MASGSSGLPSNSGSKGFDFASDDILCAYEDYTIPENSTRGQSDPAIGSNSGKELHKNRMTRSSMLPTPAYHLPEGSSFNQDVIGAVDKSMKKHTDNLMRFLEGISSRLSDLELYCYNLDKSIGEIHSGLVHDHEDSNNKLKSLEKHLQEVHRSIQILRDKQELAEAQEELAKLQLARKVPTSASNNISQQDGERMSHRPSSSDTTNMHSHNNPPELQGQQFSLSSPHPHQTVVTQPVPSLPSQVSIAQPQGYYLPPPAPPSQFLPQGGQHMPPSNSQFLKFANLPPHPSSQAQPVQASHSQSEPSYQQQWLPPQQQIQQPSDVYLSYPPNQPNPAPEMGPNNMSSGISQPAPNRSDGMPYGNRPAQQLQAPANHHLKPAFGTPGDGYGNSYVMYDGSEGERGHHHPPTFPQGSYPPHPALPAVNTNVMAHHPSQMTRNHPHNELIEKLVSMGYRGDHVINVIQRLEESGQAVDFNAVLDRLNGHSSGGGFRKGW
ncbi:unnamed protein product [Cuscuta europaea]|uniref:DUF1421 domain-containing protein n=1 Tax=Cuscuta europaea TaxID=41803 RepID=A0A9P0ZY50_CUSEU|nr:unnamed protein product [Cuscuta europaea]